MILLFVFGLAVMWAFLCGGSISNLPNVSLRGNGIVLTAFSIQVLVIYLPLPNVANQQLHILLLLVSYAMLGVFIWWNRNLPGMWLIGIGFAANWGAILANGGHMPIT